MLPLLSLLACGPGTLDTRSGPDELVTALYQVRPDQDRDELRILLANSALPCDLELEPALLADPRQAQAACEAQVLDSFATSAQEPPPCVDLLAALTREDARILYIRAYRLYSREHWVGFYPLYNERLESHLDGTSPYAFQAWTWEVDEAIVDESDGLFRTYLPTELRAGWAESPGEMRISADGGRVNGQLDLPGVHISSTFRASACPEDSNLFDYAELLDELPRYFGTSEE